MSFYLFLSFGKIVSAIASPFICFFHLVSLCLAKGYVLVRSVLHFSCWLQVCVALIWLICVNSVCREFLAPVFYIFYFFTFLFRFSASLSICFFLLASFLVYLFLLFHFLLVGIWEWWNMLEATLSRYGDSVSSGTRVSSGTKLFCLPPSICILDWKLCTVSVIFSWQDSVAPIPFQKRKEILFYSNKNNQRYFHSIYLKPLPHFFLIHLTITEYWGSSQIVSISSEILES